MDDIGLTVDATDFERHLNQLPDQVAKRYLGKALQKAGDVILASMKQLAPERTDEATPEEDSLPPGILREDLHTQVTVSSNGGATVKVGPTEISAHVCRWQEKGWMLTSHEGKKIRQIPGKHFMSAAMDEAGQAALDAFTASLKASLELNTDDEETF